MASCSHRITPTLVQVWKQCQRHVGIPKNVQNRMHHRPPLAVRSSMYMSTQPATLHHQPLQDEIVYSSSSTSSSSSDADTLLLLGQQQQQQNLIHTSSPPIETNHTHCLKEYFDTHLRSAMLARQKATVLRLYHEYLQHVDPISIHYTPSQSDEPESTVLLLSPDVYASLIYILTPQDIHGAILAFQLYQRTLADVLSSQHSNRIKTLELIQRILRSVEEASPMKSRFHTCYSPFFPFTKKVSFTSPTTLIHSSPKSHPTSTGTPAPTTRRLYAMELLQAVYLLQSIIQKPLKEWNITQQEEQQDVSHRTTRALEQDFYDLIPRFIYALLTQKYSTTFLTEMTLDLWNSYKEAHKETRTRGDIENEMMTSPSMRYEEEVEKDYDYETEQSSSRWNTPPRTYLWCENILRCSTYRRQQLFPFGDVLLFVLSKGGRPSPTVVLNVVQHEFPFDNIRLLERIFKGLIHLQQTKESWQLDYRLDIGTLQHISVMAARRGSSELMFLIWDYIELLNYEPVSEGVYEDTIVALVETRYQDPLVLHVMAEMEHKGGFIPQRPLIRSVSRSIRPVMTRIQNFLRLIQKRRATSNNRDRWEEKEDDRGGDVTTAMLNCVLSAYAEWGLVDKAFDVFDEFNKLHCAPNDDTFAFLMEAVAINVTTAIETNPAEMDDWGPWISSQLDSVEVIILTMSQMKCSWSHPMIYNYIRILCASGELNKALEFLHETESSENISLDTFILLATNFASQGNRHAVDTTKELCQRHGHSLPVYASERLDRLLHTRIKHLG